MMRKLGLLVLVWVTLCLGPAAAQDLTTSAGINDEYRRVKALADAGNLIDAIAGYERLLAAAQSLSPPFLAGVGQLQLELAGLHGRSGRRDLEIDLARAAAATMRAAYPPESFRIAQADLTLGYALAFQQRLDEAVDVYWRGLAAADLAVGNDAVRFRWGLRGLLGRALLQLERPHEALVLLDQAVTTTAALPTAFRDKAGRLICALQRDLGDAQFRLRDYEAAAEVLRGASDCDKALGDPARDRISDILLARVLARQGLTEAAMALAHEVVTPLRETLKDPKRRYSNELILRHAARVALDAEDRPAAFQWLFDRSPLVDPSGDKPMQENPARDRIEFAELVVDGAEYWFGVDDVQQSTTYARWALEALRARAARVSAGARGTDEGERRRIRALASRMVELMAATTSTRQGREWLWNNELVNIAQVAHATAVGQAIAQMAGRLSAGDGALARLLTERRDAALAWSRADRDLSTAFGEGIGGAALDAIRRERDAAGAVLDGIDRRLAKDFPQAARHAGFDVFPAAAIGSLLRPDEAVLFYLIGEKRSAVWLFTPDSVRMTTLAIGEAELDGMVAQLREGVDPARVRGVSDLPAFDVHLARMLHQRLVRPIGNSFGPAVRHLLVVPDGPLHALPFQLLIGGHPTAPPPDPARLADAHWLVKDYAISTLPSLGALVAFRSDGRPSRATQPFLGVGDPLLDDRAGRSRGGAAMFGDDDASWLRGARGAGAEGALERLYRGGRADTAALRRLPSLPDTAIELTALAQSLKAPAESLRLREAARETLLKQRDALKDYRILAFATHGVTAGEIRGTAEPGLVLTPPEEASEADDGLLTAGEIAGLDLDADWVILSACNTAAGDGQPGAQGLSGLGRAFFLAGSRSLLVSHWPVFSRPAVQLTTAMMARLDADPTMARAEAQRRAMLEMIADRERPFLAHPVFWAPFSVVGEGGALAAR